MEILIEDFSSDDIVIGFRNSNGEVEYTIYEPRDGGTIGDPDSDIGAIIASDCDITEYQDYTLKEIP